MELESFVGMQTFYGVDFGLKSPFGDDGVACKFNFGGVNYLAVEDANDGYRSMLRDIVPVTGGIQNYMMGGVRVLAVMRDSCWDEVLDVYSCDTGKKVFSVGTSSPDSYYPSFIFEYYPENLPQNQ